MTTPATAVSYVVQVATNGGAPVAMAQQTTLNANPVIAAGNSYTLQVLSQATRFGLTTQSGLSNTLTLNTPPAASTRPTAAAGAAGTKQIAVTWTNPSSNITGWIVQRTSTARGATAVAIVPTIAANGTSYSFVDTAPAGSYTYRVQATNVVGSSALTAASVAVTAP